MPVWHASVARLGKGRTLRFEELTAKHASKGTRVARLMLKGVGEGDGIRFRSDPAGYAIHVQKPLADEEISLLPDGWMAIPAVDEVGPRIIF